MGGMSSDEEGDTWTVTGEGSRADKSGAVSAVSAEETEDVEAASDSRGSRECAVRSGAGDIRPVTTEGCGADTGAEVSVAMVVREEA